MSERDGTLPVIRPLLGWLGGQSLVWLGIGILTLGWHILHRRAERRRILRFELRTVLSENDWFAVTAADDPAVEKLPRDQIVAILKVFGDWIGITPTQLRWTDRIGDLELPESFLIDDSWNAYEESLRDLVEKLSGNGFVPDPNWVTLGDVIKGTIAQGAAKRDGSN